MTTSSSSNDKPNVTISSSSGEQVKPRKMKSKRYVKRSAKVDQPTVDSTDEQEAEQPIKQRRKRKFVKRSNPVPLTTRSSEDEVASDDGEIFISPECPTANNLFTEEQRIKSGPAPLLTERRTKMVFGISKCHFNFGNQIIIEKALCLASFTLALVGLPLCGISEY